MAEGMSRDGTLGKDKAFRLTETLRVGWQHGWCEAQVIVVTGVFP